MEFERLSLLIGRKNLEKISTKTVLVLGVGGVGGYFVEAMARSGIGRLIIVDPDCVDETNINRQLIALHSTIGKSKVEVFQSRIQDITSCCKVSIKKIRITEENISTLFQEPVDYIFDASDTVSTKIALIEQCKLKITELSKTQHDPLARIMRKKIREKNIKQKIMVVFSEEMPKKIDSPIIASGIFVPSSAGILAASYVFQKLLDGE